MSLTLLILYLYRHRYIKPSFRCSISLFYLPFWKDSCLFMLLLELAVLAPLSPSRGQSQVVSLTIIELDPLCGAVPARCLTFKWWVQNTSGGLMEKNFMILCSIFPKLIDTPSNAPWNLVLQWLKRAYQASSNSYYFLCTIELCYRKNLANISGLRVRVQTES